MGNNQQNRERARIAVYVIGGFYLDYLAYELFGELSSIQEKRPLFLFFTVLFAVAGTGIMIGGLWKYYKLSKAPKQEEDPETQEDSEEHSEEHSEEIVSGAELTQDGQTGEETAEDTPAQDSEERGTE